MLMYVYADNAATTALSPRALEAMMPYFSQVYGNASSLHSPGQRAAEALQKAREDVAAAINADFKEIYFTGGGSEADNQAILTGAAIGARKGKKHIISTAFEHHAVLHTLAKLEKEGYEVTLLPVHENGVVTAQDVAAAIRPDTALVTIMFVNNEIGTIQPIAQIGAVCREKGVALTNVIEGGQQERGKRGGTENIPGIVGMAAAIKEATENLDEDMAYVTALREKLIEGLSKIPHSRLNGDRQQRVPGTVNFCFEGIEGEGLLLWLDQKGVAASSGSACTSGSLDPSHVLLALGLPHEIAHGSLRLSVDRWNTEEEIDHILQAVPEVVDYLRAMSPVWDELERGVTPHLI